MAKPVKPDMTRNLERALRAAREQQKPTGIRRTKSNNPSRVAVKESLRVEHTVDDEVAAFDYDAPFDPDVDRPAMGGAQSLYDQTATPLDAVPRMRTAAELFAETEPQVDRTEYLSPTPTLNSERPRAREARYNPDTRHLTVVFRSGGTYTYYEVPSRVWRALKRNKSFGRTLDRLVINVYAYERVSF